MFPHEKTSHLRRAILKDIYQTFYLFSKLLSDYIPFTEEQIRNRVDAHINQTCHSAQLHLIVLGEW
jgi:hypothetical protein